MDRIAAPVDFESHQVEHREITVSYNKIGYKLISPETIYYLGNFQGSFFAMEEVLGSIPGSGSIWNRGLLSGALQFPTT